MNTNYKASANSVHDTLGVRMGIISPDYPESQMYARGRFFLGVYASIVGIFAAAFLLLAFLVKENDTKSFDETVGHWIQGTNPPAAIAWLTQSAPWDWVLTNLSLIGNAPWSYLAYAGVFLGLFVLGQRVEAAVALGGSLFAVLAGSLLRSYIDRARPSVHFLNIAQHVSGAGFPSGHVMMYVTLFGFAFYAVLIAWRWNAFKIVTLAVLAFLVIFIGLSRVYLGAHWPTDTTGAYLVGWIIVAGMIETHRYLLRRLGEVRSTVTAPLKGKSAQPA